MPTLKLAAGTVDFAAMSGAAEKIHASAGNPRPSQQPGEEESQIAEEVQLGMGVVGGGGSPVVAGLSAPLERPRIRGLVYLHYDQVLIESLVTETGGILAGPAVEFCLL